MANSIDVFQKYGIDRNKKLIQVALTHANYLIGGICSDIHEDYQRLEFLGDKVVGLVVAQLMYTKKNSSEQVMTKEFQFITTNDNHYRFSKFLRIR